MTIIEIISAVLIHLLIPLAGLLFYLRLIKRIKKEDIENPPIVDLFFIFSTYGGLLLVTLTALFWKWSGMASLGTFYLILGAPVVMGFISYTNHKNKELSKYHMLTYKTGLLYFLIAPLIILILVAIDK